MYCTKARGTRLSMFSRYSMCTCVNRCQKRTIFDMVFYHDTNVELLHRARITGWIWNVRPCDNCSDVIDIGLFSNSFTLCLNVVYQNIILVRYFVWFYKMATPSGRRWFVNICVYCSISILCSYISSIWTKLDVLYIKKRHFLSFVLKSQILKRSRDCLLYTKKETNCVLFIVNIWLRYFYVLNENTITTEVIQNHSIFYNEFRIFY